MDVKLFVESTLAPNYLTSTDDKLIVNFLLELQQSRAIGDVRLFYCIAIDLKNSIKRYGTSDALGNPLIVALRETILKTSSHVGTITKTFPHGIPPQVRFALVSKKPSDYMPSFKCTTERRYMRITSFKDYLRYVVKINLSPKLAKKIPEDIDDTNMRRYLLSYLNNGKFKEVEITRLGRPNSWVFVADIDEIGKDNFNEGSDVSNLIDRLGFYIDKLSPNEHFLCLRYDSAFDEVLFQPESLTADWGNIISAGGLGNEFFLSHAINDGWGRTHCISGTQQSMKERIHSSFDYNNLKYYQMATNSLGTAKKNLGKGNIAILIKEAIDRFENA